MADIHITGSASCADTRALEGRSRQISGHVAEEHTPGAKWCEDTGNIEMRSHQDLRGRIRVSDVREQEQRQESTASTVHVDPPLSIHVVATVDVPPGVSRILLAWEPNRNGPTDSFALNPTTGSEERVVGFPERGRRGRGCESGTFGARETDDRLGPGLGIARIDSSRPQFAFDDVHAGPHSVRRHSPPDHKESVRTEIVNGCGHLAHRAGPSTYRCRLISLRPTPCASYQCRSALRIRPVRNRIISTLFIFRQRPLPYSLRSRESSRIFVPTAIVPTCAMSPTISKDIGPHYVSPRGSSSDSAA